MVYLRFPREHWTRVRHSNFIERTFGETRRRVKVIDRLPGEHSCLKLVWAVLDRASAGWRGFTMTPAGLRLLQDQRRTLHDPPTQLLQRNSEITPKLARRRPSLSAPPHRIITASERSLRQATFTPLLGRHPYVPG
uniref:Transposase, Mutator family n=1 Tax=Mycobacterium riyadhense TaxID=486698 RepID=A0A653ESN0_9MYCO|nr:transposase [Mycobacterium riyadhense]VTP00595.1 Transposase, Mutator family [Mycobacterium riyadhense]